MRPKGCSNSTLDSLWAKRVKEKGVCDLCQAGFKGYGPLSAHHFHSKKNHSVRWWVPNGVPLCHAHHLAERYSAHLNPAWFQKIMVEIRGEEWLNDLIQRTAKIFHWQKHLKEIKQYLNGDLEDYLE
jgi:hypothetical protein